jgi:hypothetical protein
MSRLHPGPTTCLVLYLYCYGIRPFVDPSIPGLHVRCPPADEVVRTLWRRHMSERQDEVEH